MADKQGSRQSKRLSLIARTTVAIVALAWVFRGQDWAGLARAFEDLRDHPAYFALSLAVFLAAQVLISARWWFLLRAQSVYISLWVAVRLNFLGLFYNNLMPGSVGGDLLRAWYVAKHTHRRVEAVLSVFVDRVVGLIGMLLIALFCYVLFMPARAVTAESDQPPAAAPAGPGGRWIPVVLGACLVVVLTGMAAHPKGRRLFGRAWSYLAAHGARLVGLGRDAIVLYCRKPLTMLFALGLTIVLQSPIIAAFYLLGRSLRIEAEAKYYFVFFPLAWVASALPVSVAGIGILEGSIVELFERFAGVERARASALALCQRFVWVLASLPGAFVHLLGAHLPGDFSIDSDGPLD